MRKFILTPLIVILLSFMATLNLTAQDLMITGVFDGPLAGGTPKVLELYAVNDIADLSVYTVKNQTNANTTWGNSFALSGSATSGDYIYVVYVDGNMSNFNDYFANSLTPPEANVINLNGDDRIGLFNDSDVLFDIYGEDGVDGTDSAWEWLDGWAYRNAGATASATFVESDWTYSGTDVTDGETTNATATTPFPIGTFTMSGCTPISTFPFEENFDGDWTSWCWTVIDNDSDGTTWEQDDAYISPRSGDWTAHGMGNDDDYLISPEIAVTSAYLFVNWWDIVESSSYNNTYDVLVSTTDTDISSFSNNLGTFDCTNTEWTEHSLSLSAFDGQNIYIAFHQTYSAATNYGFGIDDLSIIEITCLSASDLTLGTVNAYDVTLSWTENGSATAWNIIYGAPGFDPETEGTTVAADANPFTVNGLSPITDYDFYVQADCGSGDLSDWSSSVSATTECGVYTAPYLEDFTEYLPTCWEEADGPASGPTTTGSSDWSPDGFANDGSSGSARMNIYDNDDEEWLISPEFDLSAGGLELNFDIAVTTFSGTTASAMGSDDEVQLLYTTDGSSWTNLMTWNTSNTPSNTGDAIITDLSTITGTNVRFAFWATDGTTDDSEDYNVYIDNFVIREIPTCREISSLSVDSYTAYETTLSWTEQGSATAWNIIYGAPGFDPETEGTTVAADATTFTVNSLSPETDYDFYVQADCGSGDLSTLVGSVSATTLPSCLAPTDLAIDSYASSEVTLSWTENGTTDAWNIIYGAPGFDPETEGTTVAADANPFTVTGLSANTDYDLYVQADCGSGDLSYWSSSVSVTTDCEAVSSLPYTENFDSYDTGSDAFPDCWERPVTYTPYSTYPSCVSGNYTSSPNSLKFQSLTTDPTFAVTPAFSEDINNLMVTFSLKAESTTSSGVIEVGVMSDPNEISTFELVQTIDPEDTDMNEYSVFFNNTTISGANNYIAFKHVSNASNYYFWLDDVTVSEAPSCLPVADLIIDSYTAFDVTLSWTEQGSATAWNIIYGTPGFDPETEGTTIAADATTFTVNSLSPETEYDFYVQTDCGSGDLSTLVGPVSTTTLPTCLAPTDLAVDSYTSSDVTLSWTENGTTDAWNIIYGASGFDPETEGTTIAADANPFTINSLSANTNYDFYVQADCGSGDLSHWSGSVSVTTECEAVTSFPFTENFDEDWSTWCWTVINNDDDSYEWSQSSQYITAHSGSYTAHGTGNSDDYLITPQLTLSGNYTITWWDVVEGESHNNTYDVLLSTTDTDLASFTVNLGTFDCTNTAWEMHALDLSAYDGSNIYIAFHQTYSSSAYWGFGIDDVTVREINSEANFITFSFTEQTGAATIDDGAHTIDIEVANGTDMTNLVASYTLSSYATTAIAGTDQESGVTANNFSSPVTYTVTAEDGSTQNWVVTVTEATTQSSENDILTFELAEQTGAATIGAGTVDIEVGWQTNLSSLTPTITISTLASISPESGVAQDFTTPVTYTVTAEDESTQDWVVTVTKEADPEGSSCDNPYTLTLPADFTYEHLSQTTCGLGNIYEDTDMSSYDNGEDAIYEITVTEDVIIDVTLEPGTPASTGVGIFESCPSNNLLIDYDSYYSGSSSLENIYLAAGTYYLMVDSYSWYNDCISEYDLTIEESCITPSAVTQSMTPTTAVISWTPEGLETTWDLKVSTTSIDPTTETGDIFDGIVSTTPEQEITTLTAETDYYVYVQANCGSGWTTEYMFTTPATCPVPTNLNAVVASTGVTLTWEEYGATDWILEVSTTPLTDPSTETGDILDNQSVSGGVGEYLLSGLAIDETTYYWYVMSDCGGEWSEEGEFYLGYCISAGDNSTYYINNFETTGGTDNISNTSSGYSTNGYIYEPLMVVSQYATGTISFTASFGSISTYTYGFGIWVDWNNDMDFDDTDENVYISSSYATSYAGDFNVPEGTANGDYRMRIVANYNSTAPSACNTDINGETEDYTLTVIDAPSCMPVSDIVVDSYTSTEVTLSWVENGSATEWNIIYGAPGFDPETEGTTAAAGTMPFTVESLTAETEYDFYVQANCGVGDLSTLVGPVTATTAIACPVPTDIVVNSSTDMSEITWNAYGQTEWYIKVSTSSIDPATTDGDILANELISANPYTVMSLTSNTTYYVYIQSSCGSDWSDETSFTTECDAVTAPYSQDFEGFTLQEGFSVDNCWRGIGAGADDIDVVNSTGFDMGSPYSGSVAIELNDGAYSSDLSAFVTPELADLGLGDKQIRFYAIAEDYTENELYIAFIDNSLEVSSLNIFDTISFDVDDTWEEYTIMLNNTAIIGSATRIAFVHDNSLYEIGLDDFIYEEMPSCPSVSDIAVDSYTTTEATLSWTENGSATEWYIIYGDPGFDPETEGTTVTADAIPFTVNSLLPSTTYDVYVQANCGSGDLSTITDPVTFTTECDAVTVFPWTESFEEDVPPVCWSEIRTPASTYGWSSNSSGLTGNCARFESYYNDEGNVSELITSTLDISVLTNPVFRFTYKNPTGGDFTVLLSTDDGATYPNTLFTDLTSTSDWTEMSADLSPYIGTQVKIAFVGTSNYAPYGTDGYIYLDDVIINEASSETDFLSYSFPEQTFAPVIDDVNHTITAEVGNGTDLTDLVANFTLSAYATTAIAGTDQESGVTANNFSSPVTYTVTAEDGTTQDWIVTVTEASVYTETDFLSYSFPEETGAATIDDVNHTIDIEVNWLANLTDLVADFTLSYGASATISGTAQESGVTTNNFSSAVTYTVTAEDGTTTQDWVVTVTMETSPLGATCDNPFTVTLPADLTYSDLGQTTCGFGDAYENTEMDDYDGGEDVIYELTVTEEIVIDVNIDPYSSTWTGIGVFDACPETGTLLASSYSSSSSNPHSIENLILAPGTYYLMVDTWPSPNCITQYDLTIEVNTAGMYAINTDLTITPETQTIFDTEDANGSMEIVYPTTIPTGTPDNLLTDALLDLSELNTGAVIELFNGATSLGSYTVTGGETVWASDAFTLVTRPQANTMGGVTLNWNVVISDLTEGTYDVDVDMYMGSDGQLTAEDGITELASDTMTIIVQTPVTDLALLEPTSGYACDLTDATPIPVEFENVGNMVIASGETVTFTLESEESVILTENITLDSDLNPSESWSGFTTNTVDLSAIGTTLYSAAITYSADENTTNDTIEGYIVHFEQTLEFVNAVNDTITISSTDWPYTIQTNVTFNPDSTLVTDYLWEDMSTGSTLVVNADGWYSLTILTEGCEYTDSVYVLAYNNIADINNNEFAVYPNPSNGQFIIEMTLTEAQDVIITIVNTNGQVVREMKFDDIEKLTREVNLNDVAEGLYNIRINAGGKMINRQIIIR